MAQVKICGKMTDCAGFAFGTFGLLGIGNGSGQCVFLVAQFVEEHIHGEGGGAVCGIAMDAEMVNYFSHLYGQKIRVKDNCSPHTGAFFSA